MKLAEVSWVGVVVWIEKMIKVASLGLDEDLSRYSRFLKQKGIGHRIIEEAGSQSIYIADLGDLNSVKSSLTLYMADNLNLEENFAEGKPVPGPIQFITLVKWLLQTPVTSFLILTSLFVAIQTSLGSNMSTYSVLLYPLSDANSLVEVFSQLTSLSAALKTVAPMFLHFGELHLVFNMIWMWYFGKQLEEVLPAWFFISLVALISFISNTVQYLTIEYNNFGGMSGVIYGLAGYSWILTVFQSQRFKIINHNLFIFFVCSLVLMELFASSWIATAAHLGGLLSGLVFGICHVLFDRIKLRISYE